MTTTIVADKVFEKYIGQGNFLSDYPDAIIAYSLRTIGTSYVGPLIRVRRSSDSTERDFYAYYGSVNIDEIKTFVGATGTAFVSVWYDQSGNGLHAYQPVLDSQPQVIRNGTVVLFNNKNCLLFDGVDDCLQVPDQVACQFNNGFNVLSVFTACIPKDNTQAFTILSLAGRANVTPSQNDLISFQANAAYNGTVRQRVGMFLRKYAEPGNIDRSAVGGSSPVSDKSVIFGITRYGGMLTINDADTTATVPDMTVGALNLSLATLGAARRGVNGSVESSNPNSKIAELVVYRKSYESVLSGVINNMVDYYLV